MHESNNLIERTIDFLYKRRDKILKGEINCIPLPFKRFRNELPGIEQGTYYLISGLGKSSKTQITSYLFLYNSLLYAYNNPSVIDVKFFFFPLEETPEAITLRFMSYLLWINYKIRVSPVDLKSTDSDRPINKEILDKLSSKEVKDILNFYEEKVIFLTDRNPTGIWKVAKNYADNNGEAFYKTINVNGEERKLFDYYVPKNPNEYVFIIVDHVSLIESERGMTLRESINKLSEYMVILRNRYNYIPVVVQQQSVETGNLEAFKAGKIRPTLAGLGDSKYTGRDCSVMLGITNPYAFELSEYYGYDIKKLKGNFRVLEVVLNRNGVSNGLCPLFFDGAINLFEELPKPTDNNINKVYEYSNSLRNKVFMLISKKYNNNLLSKTKLSIFANLFKK